MTDKKITRGQAIEQIINLIQNGYYIPMCSGEDDCWSGFSWVSPDVDVANYLIFANDFDNYDFKVVPKNEIIEDFTLNGVHLEDYDICVEFIEKTEENPYKEQYLLWNVD